MMILMRSFAALLVCSVSLLAGDITFVPGDKTCKVGVPFKLTAETKGKYVQWSSTDVALIKPFENTDNKSIWFVPMVEGSVRVSGYTSIEDKATPTEWFTVKVLPNGNLPVKPPNVKPVDPTPKPVDPVPTPKVEGPYKVLLFVDNVTPPEMIKLKSSLAFRNLLDSTKSDLQEWPSNAPWIDEYKWRQYLPSTPYWMIVGKGGVIVDRGPFTTAESVISTYKEKVK